MNPADERSDGDPPPQPVAHATVHNALAQRRPRAADDGCLLLLLVGLYLVLGPRLGLSEWRVPRENNTALDEALQWKKGTLELSRDFYEDAEFDGKHYNVVGLAFVLISLVGTTLTGWMPASVDAFDPALYVLFVAAPLPLLGYWAFRQVGSPPPWAAVLAAYLLVGTSLAPVLTTCRTGSIYYINHALAVSGLLLLAGDLLGRRRIWPAAIGLCLAAWSRQTTGLYALPLLWIAWRWPAHEEPTREPGTDPAQPPADPNRRRRRALWRAAIGVGLAILVPATLNAIKFGNPLETGYAFLYKGRTDPIGRRAQEQLVGLRYVPMQARAMNTAFPAWDIRQGALFADTSNTVGSSVWLTSPLLLALPLTFPRWWRDGRRRALVLSTLPVIALLLCYHTTGADGDGYYRYSLDFVPVWLLAVAPETTGPRGRPLTLACLAFSALYFYLIPA